MAKKKSTSPGKMHIRLENSKTLKVLIEALSSIYDEVRFDVDQQGIFTNFMDPSRICMARVVLKSACFDDFEVSGTHTIPINLEDFNKILKRSNNDIIELEHDIENLKLKIKFSQEGKDRGRNFSLSELDLDIEDVEMANLLKIEYATKVVMDPDQLTGVLKDADIYGEVIEAKIEDTLEFNADGAIGDYSFTSELDDLIESKVEEFSKGSFSIPYLKNIMKLIPITEKLELFLKSEHPMKMIFNLLGGGKVFYFLAPRVAEEDFDEDDMEAF